MSKIRKLVIPVAGFGTRFLPVTKAIPKEILPVVDKPIIQYVVEDAVASGITDIILVTSPAKQVIEEYFSLNSELENWLIKNSKEELAKEINKISKLANFIFIKQQGPYGNGTPVLCGKDLVGNEPFAVMWGDEFFYTPQKPHLAQLIEVFEEFNSTILTAHLVDDEGTTKYGILEAREVKNKVYQINNIIEKPEPWNTPSHLASLGGFIFTPDIFFALAHTKIGKGGELWLVDAVVQLLKTHSVYAKLVEGEYYDTGSKFGWLKANVELALKHPDLAKDFKNYLQNFK